MIIDDLCIMSGRHGVTTKGHGKIEEYPKFYAFVASYAGRRRLTVCIRIPSIGQDDVFEIVANVADKVFNAEVMGDSSGFFDVVVACADTCAVGVFLHA